MTPQLDREQDFIRYRNDFTEFVYQDFSWRVIDFKFEIEYKFEIKGLSEFTPTWIIPLPKDFDLSEFDEKLIDKLVFNLGMVELVSYWKISCAPKIIVKCGELTEKQIDFWKKLYFKGLGEFFFLNNIQTNFESFCSIQSIFHNDKSLTEEKIQSNIFNFKGKKIGIWGFGREGKSTLKYLQNLHSEDQPREILVYDDNLNIPEVNSTLDEIAECDLILKAPGIDLLSLSIKMQEAFGAGRITSQTDLFLQKYGDYVIGITGTKGKSTTTSIIYHILKENEKYQNRVLLGGNIGVPLFDLIPKADKILSGGETPVVVAELSCHQLEILQKGPKYPILLNLFPEHLDHYGTFEKYCQAKLNIYKGRNSGCLVPIGGGKDSITSLDILKNSILKSEEKSQFLLYPYIINSRGATEGTVEAAELTSNTIRAKRTLDRNMLELNQNGFLNGHTPFSSIVASSSELVAYLYRLKYTVLSNEDSANEATAQSDLLDLEVNHQYSKSLEFEKDFNSYCEDNFPNVDNKYFSLLRAMTEYQIAKHFATASWIKEKGFHKIFRSCNAGSKQDIWCGECPKCLFVYIILSPHLEQTELVGIFGKNLLDDKNLQTDFDKLCGIEKNKPFECVGSRDEVNLSIQQTIMHLIEMKKDLPFLLRHYLEDKPFVLPKNGEIQININDLQIVEGIGDNTNIPLLFRTDCDLKNEIDFPDQILGRHNRSNVLVAYRVLKENFNITNNEFNLALQSFKPLAHRLQFVGVDSKNNGSVRYYDDSISTAPQTTIAAIEALLENNQRIGWLILGGLDRGIDYQPLFDYLTKERVVQNLLIVPDMHQKFQNALARSYSNHLYLVNNLEEAIAIVKKESCIQENLHGSCCLLSPAAASYNSYKNFEERGEFFQKISLNLS
ncbi:MAG: hypothetical protein LBM13_01800 [Candidatus Ancillula sp.]|nr:hypothetical protein [Candidatus Ancillula sp.]